MILIPTPIPIVIHPLFWVVCLLIGFFNSGFNLIALLAWVLVIFFSVLIHELGHAITAKSFGQSARIDLVGFGGVTTHTGRNLSAPKNFFIVLNGPIMGFLLFGILMLVRPYVPQVNFLQYTIRIGIIINFLWTALNLLPILPLDGGQLLRIVLERFFGIAGIKATAMIGLVISVGFGVFCLLRNQLILALFFFFFAMQSLFTFRALKQMKAQDNNMDLINQLKQGQKKMMEGRNEEAEAIFLALCQQTKEGIIFLQATQLLASLFKQKGDYKKAYDLLHAVRKNLSVEGKMVLQELAFVEGQFEEALALGKECYEEFPEPEIAFRNSCCCGRLGRAMEAISWLKSAVDKGLQDPLKVLEREEFNSIRTSQEFQQFIASLKK